MNSYSGVSTSIYTAPKLLCYRALYTQDLEAIWATVQLYNGYVEPKLSYTYFWIIESYASVLLLCHPNLVRYSAKDYYA